MDFVQVVQPDYKAAAVHRHIAARLEQFSRDVAAGKEPRLALMMPPRHGKSLLASIMLPVWHLGQHPDHEIIVAGHTLNLVRKFSKRARSLAADNRVLDIFPSLKLSAKSGRDRKSSAATEWETEAGGVYRAAGIGGGITGLGAHILIVDDPIKDAAQAESALYRERIWDWYTTTASTRLAPGGGVLLIMTRWHQDDLAGRLLRAGDPDDEDAEVFETIRFPAIADEQDVLGRQPGEALDPRRYPLPVLHRRRTKLGEYSFASLFQQSPAPRGGGVWKLDWFRFYSRRPEAFDEVIQSWDLSFGAKETSSYAVGQVWGRIGADCYLLDQWRAQAAFPDQIKAIVRMTEKWPDATAKLVEAKANGQAVLDTLGSKVPGLIPVNPDGTKTQRAEAVSPLIQAGNVYLPDPADQSWVRSFLDEATMFPRAAHDDQVDAASQALRRFVKPEPEFFIEYLS